jgi:protein LSM14
MFPFILIKISIIIMILGSKISLISKKNIRYEGTLYSINETDATVALQNVRAFGTEGRETEDSIAVPASDQIHPYLLFRGQDIKDLHVHENAAAVPPAVNEPSTSSNNNSNSPTEKSKSETKTTESNGTANAQPQGRDVTETTSTKSKKMNSGRVRASNHKSQNQRMVGSGASLLHRKARGAVDGVEGKS